MTTELLQDAAVTLVALGAAAMLVRRIVALMRAERPSPGCPSCGPGCEASRAPAPPAAAAVPLKLIRRPPTSPAHRA